MQLSARVGLRDDEVGDGEVTWFVLFNVKHTALSRAHTLGRGSFGDMNQ